PRAPPRRPRLLGVCALLPARLALGAHPVALAAAENRQLLEVGGLEQHVLRRLPHLRLGAPHHARDRYRTLPVGDHEVLRRELTGRAVEGLERLARTGA